MPREVSLWSGFMTDTNVHDIVVVGAGIIGVSTALALQAAGRDVLLLDRKGDNAKASEMNAGAFAFSDIVPLATPGIMRKVPKWLLDPLGPLSIPPSYAFKIAPWMLRFWRSSWPDRFRTSLAAQAALMNLSRSALDRQVQATEGEKFLRREGQLQLFEGEREFRQNLPTWELRRQNSVRFELLKSREAIVDIQPGIHPRFTHAGFTPDWINACDPALWLEHLCDAFKARGGLIKPFEITALKSEEGSVRLQCADSGFFARQVIISAGAWSHKLARSLDDRFPLETERGYNTTLPDGAFDLKTHLTFSSHGFVVSRINGGVRVGGAVELGGLNFPAKFKRADVLLNKAKAFLPELKTTGGKQWMGFRPSLPDSLPIIDRSPKDPRVIYAFGHGHLGLTQSAGTAELVAALATNSPPSIDISAFSARRF
ncbi:D-amino acid dehydrogenase small subunit [Roseibium album]|nr:D-amino acid dehydrogenase small subunit [Roseibium album]